MTQGRLDQVIHQVQRLRSPSAEESSDRHLLDRFARQADQSAFAELVTRHGGIVMAVCRRLLADAHEAEDAFQATWLVLARKSSKNWSDSIAGWLYEVAHRVACKARTIRPPGNQATGAAGNGGCHSPGLSAEGPGRYQSSPSGDGSTPGKGSCRPGFVLPGGQDPRGGRPSPQLPARIDVETAGPSPRPAEASIAAPGHDAGAGGPGGIARVLVGRRRARGGAASDHPGRDPGRGRQFGGGGGQRSRDRPGRRSIARDELREAETGPVPDPDARDLHGWQRRLRLPWPGGRETHQGCLGQRGPEQTLSRTGPADRPGANLPLQPAAHRLPARRWRNAARPGHDRVPCPQHQGGQAGQADQHSRWGCLVRAADGLRIRHRWGRLWRRPRKAGGQPGRSWWRWWSADGRLCRRRLAGRRRGHPGWEDRRRSQSCNAQAGGRFLRRADRRCGSRN